MSHITLDGEKFLVSPQWAKAVKAALGTLDFSRTGVASERLRLLRLSNDRPLTKSEQAVLAHLTHVFNVINTIRVVGDHHDPAEWGLDGWDAVHGNSHRADCGCVHHYVFDHHAVTNHFGHNRAAQAEPKKHAIEPLYVCEAHGP